MVTLEASCVMTIRLRNDAQTFRVLEGIVTFWKVLLLPFMTGVE